MAAQELPCSTQHDFHLAAHSPRIPRQFRFGVVATAAFDIFHLVSGIERVI